jgi:hypothetical protein
MAEEADLWVSRTNSADDSRGMAFGLSGDLFIPVVLGAFISVTMFTCIVMFEWLSIQTGLVWSLLPVGGAIGYVLAFRHNKPPHYDVDLFEDLVVGEDGAQRRPRQPLSPSAEAVKMDKSGGRANKKKSRR